MQCLCRGIVTLSKLQPITPMYRAMAAPLLPASFWDEDALGRRIGGVEGAVSQSVVGRSQESATYVRTSSSFQYFN